MVSPKLAERVSGVVLHLKGVQVVTGAGRPSVRKNPFGTFQLFDEPVWVLPDVDD
jgi:hypothetical protein